MLEAIPAWTPFAVIVAVWVVCLFVKDDPIDHAARVDRMRAAYKANDPQVRFWVDRFGPAVAYHRLKGPPWAG